MADPLAVIGILMATLNRWRETLQGCECEDLQWNEDDEDYTGACGECPPCQAQDEGYWDELVALVKGVRDE